MAYEIEFGLRPGAYFYAEILVYDLNTGLAMQLAPLHQLVARTRGPRLGFWSDAWGVYVPPYVPAIPDPQPPIPPAPQDPPASAAVNSPFGLVLGSEITGEITQPVTGVLAIAIPASRFAFWRGRQPSLDFSLLAIPGDPDLTSVLATGTISFGD